MGLKRPTNLSTRFPFLKELAKEDKIFIFSTRHGFYYISIIFILFIISLTYGHSLAFTGTFVFVAIIMVSAHYTNFNLKGVYIRGIDNKEMFYEGRPAIISFSLYNSSQKDRYDVQLSIGQKYQSDETYCLKKESTAVLPLSCGELRRGVYSFDRIRLWTNFPFGIFFSWKYLKFSQQFIIYPRPHNYLKSELSQESVENSEESELVDFSGNENFHGHRLYREGDSWKHINWKVYAKKDELQVKEFSSSKKKQVYFDYDNFISLDKEQRLSQLSYLLLEAHQKQQPFGLRLKTWESDIAADERHLRLCLDKLAGFEKKEEVLC